MKTNAVVLFCLTLALSAAAVEKPVRVRYAYAPPFTGVLYNQVNLPCGPFTMDVPPSKDATS